VPLAPGRVLLAVCCFYTMGFPKPLRSRQAVKKPNIPMMPVCIIWSFLVLIPTTIEPMEASPPPNAPQNDPDLCAGLLSECYIYFPLLPGICLSWTVFGVSVFFSRSRIAPISAKENSRAFAISIKCSVRRKPTSQSIKSR